MYNVEVKQQRFVQNLQTGRYTLWKKRRIMNDTDKLNFVVFAVSANTCRKHTSF